MRALNGDGRFTPSTVTADSLTIRPVRFEDGARLTRFHDSLDASSQYLRFFSPHPHLSEGETRRFTHLDHGDREALVVVEHGAIVGVGRYDRMTEASRSVEVAFVVGGPWRGNGLATSLLHRLADLARSRGMTEFIAETLSENAPMRAVFARAGYPLTGRFIDGVWESKMDISAPPTS